MFFGRSVARREETLQADAGIEVVGSFACAEDYLMHAFRTPPAVVIMDLNLPGITGIECIRRSWHVPRCGRIGGWR